MSLATYSDLKTAIGAWRFDEGSVLTTYYDDFIDLAEARFNRILRVSEMEALDDDLTLTNGSVSLPADYLEWRNVVADTSPRRTLAFMEPMLFHASYPLSYASDPCHFTIYGGALYVRPTTASEIELYYYQKIPALSDDNTTNWLLTKSPGAYLHACVMEAAIFRGDSQHANEMAALLEVDIRNLRDDDKGSRWARASMQVAGPTP